jgi:hypothetical protein
MTRQITLTRQEAEHIVDKLEENSDIPQWAYLAEEIRKEWGMNPSPHVVYTGLGVPVPETDVDLAFNAWEGDFDKADHNAMSPDYRYSDMLAAFKAGADWQRENKISIPNTEVSSSGEYEYIPSTVDVACFHCFAGNKVMIGHETPDTQCVYRCWKCGYNSKITLSQSVLNGDMDVQTGRKL